MLVRKVLARNLHAHTQSCTFTDEIDTYTLDKWIQGTGLLFKNDYSKVKSDGDACLQPLVLALCSRRDCQQPCKTRSEDNSCVTSCNNTYVYIPLHPFVLLKDGAGWPDYYHRQGGHLPLQRKGSTALFCVCRLPAAQIGVPGSPLCFNIGVLLVCAAYVQHPHPQAESAVDWLTRAETWQGWSVHILQRELGSVCLPGPAVSDIVLARRRLPGASALSLLALRLLMKCEGTLS